MTISWVVAGFEVAGKGKYGVVLLRSSYKARVSAKLRLSHQAQRTYIAAFAIVVRCSRRRGLGVCVCGLVVDGGQSIRLISQVTVGAQIGTHPVGRAGFPNAGDNHIGTLTDPEGHDVGDIWLDGHEIVCDDGHVVAVDRKALDTFGTAVDKP